MAKRKNFQTGPATAVYPALNRPDTGFHSLGTFKCDVRIPTDEAKELISAINERYKAHIGKAHPRNPRRTDKEAVWYYEEDEEGELLKDNVVIKIRVKNLMNKEGEIWDRRPHIFDAEGTIIPMVNKKGKLLKTAPRIGGGSTVDVAFEIEEWVGKTEKGKAIKGMRLCLKAVQLLKLIEFGDGASASADSYGFTKHEGYKAPSHTEDEDYDEEEGTEEKEEEDSAHTEDEEDPDEDEFY